MAEENNNTDASASIGFSTALVERNPALGHIQRDFRWWVQLPTSPAPWIR